MNILVVIFMSYSYAVFPFKVRNVDTTVVSIVTDYLGTELSNYGDVLESRISKELLYEIKKCENDSCFLAFAKKYRVDNIVLLYIDRLGEKYIVRVRVFNSEQGKFIFNQKESADRESDLDILMQRFAKGIHEGKPVAEVVTTETVTAMESEQEPRKRATRKYFSLIVGSIFPVTGYYDEHKKIPTNLTRTLMGMHYEAKNMSIGGEWAIFSRGYGFEFPLRYFISKEDFSPYISVFPCYYFMPDVYRNYTGSKISGGNGPAIGLGGGFAFFHTYDVLFLINVKYLFILNNGPDSGIEITFGLAFGR